MVETPRLGALDRFANWLAIGCQLLCQTSSLAQAGAARATVSRLGFTPAVILVLWPHSFNA